jgi:FtsH-binding integral membrane protein
MINRPAALIAGLVVLYVGMAVVFLLAIPTPREPFAYLVAGAFATGICLMATFAIYAKSTLGRTSRRNGRSS